MTPARAVLIERAVLVLGFVAMVAAVAAFDWRVGLLFAGALATASSLDIPRRRS